MKKYLILIFIIVLFSTIITAGKGSSQIPLIQITITEQDEYFTLQPTRLQFEFDEQLYALQIRRINPAQADFLLLILTDDNTNDIMAYEIKDSFQLFIDEYTELDIDNDRNNDIQVKLLDIEGSGGLSKATFTIKLINQPKIIPLKEKKETVNITNDSSKQILNQTFKAKQDITFLQKIINQLNKLFNNK